MWPWPRHNDHQEVKQERHHDHSTLLRSTTLSFRRKYNTPKNRGGAKRHLWAHNIVPLLIGGEDIIGHNPPLTTRNHYMY
eukprot:scaffold3068_cov77-Skeletonema_dohrnii-CCMP3373.AAC.2